MLNNYIQNPTIRFSFIRIRYFQRKHCFARIKCSHITLYYLLNFLKKLYSIFNIYLIYTIQVLLHFIVGAKLFLLIHLNNINSPLKYSQNFVLNNASPLWQCWCHGDVFWAVPYMMLSILQHNITFVYKLKYFIPR